MADDVDQNFTDVTTFLNNSVVHRDGTKAMTAAFDAGSNKLVNVTAGTAGADAVNKTQLDARTPYIVYHGSGTQVYTASQTANFTIDTEVFDAGTVGAVGSAVLTIPSAGLYVLVIQASYSATGGSVGPTSSSAGVLLPRSVTAATVVNSNTAFLTAAITVTLTFTDTGSGGTLTFDVKLYRIV